MYVGPHYDDVIMTMLASQITSLTVVYSIVYSGVNQRKHQSSASLAFVREIHRGPVNFPHKWPVTRKMFPFDDVIMIFLEIKFKMIVGLLVSQWKMFFFYCFTYILMPHNMVIIYFCLPYFHVSNIAVFSTNYFSTLILPGHSLDTLCRNMFYKRSTVYCSV